MDTIMASPSTAVRATQLRSNCVTERALHVRELDVEIIESAGSADPVFLFHGNSSAAESFLPLFDSALGEHHKLVAVGLPGHGRTAWPADGEAKQALYSLSGIGRFCADVVRAYGARRYWLVGQSVSGHALLESIDAFSGAAGLALISAPPVSLQRFPQAFRSDPAGALIFKPELSEDEVEQLAAAFVSTAAPQLQQQLRHYIQRTDPEFRASLGASIARGEAQDECAIFGAAALPIALIGGTEDRFLNVDYYGSVDRARLWKGAVQMIQGAGHAVHLDQPQQVAAILRAFIGGEPQ